MENNIEKKMERIEEIVGIIDKGEESLDKTIELYEEAMKLTSEAKKYIETAEQKIIDITKKANS
jgi:exodeoxyribonuclease VII small subunit